MREKTQDYLMVVEDPKEWVKNVRGETLYSLAACFNKYVEVWDRLEAVMQKRMLLDLAGKYIIGHEPVKKLTGNLLRSLNQGLDYGIKRLLPGLSLGADGSDQIESLSPAEGSFDQEVIYRRHPKKKNTYIRLADFHSHLVEEKKHELVKLASRLGAKSITCTSTESTHSEGEASFKFNGLGFGGSEQKSRHHKAEVSAEFSPPVPGEDRPYVPDGLTWLESEQSWRKLIDLRLEEWATFHHVNLTHSNDYGVEGEFCLELEEAGINIGGTYNEIEEINKRYQVRFFPRRAYE